MYVPVLLMRVDEGGRMFDEIPAPVEVGGTAELIREGGGRGVREEGEVWVVGRMGEGEGEGEGEREGEGEGERREGGVAEEVAHLLAALYKHKNKNR